MIDHCPFCDEPLYFEFVPPHGQIGILKSNCGFFWAAQNSEKRIRGPFWIEFGVSQHGFAQIAIEADIDGTVYLYKVSDKWKRRKYAKNAYSSFDEMIVFLKVFIITVEESLIFE